MRLSHSKLATIISCPATYYLSYIQGIQTKVEKPALAIGSAVHWGIEHDTEDLSEYFNIVGGFRAKDNYTHEQLLAENMVHGYLKHKDELFDEILKDPETGERLELIEENHELFLDGKLPSKIAESKFNDFVGIIDLLLLTNKGFIIIDYKTSSFEPDWNDYLDQLYRYIYLLRESFPEAPIVKIAIVNIRKTGIRLKKGETQFEFDQRLKFEYDLNDENYINYHEFLPEDIEQSHIDEYISNLAIMSDVAASIDKNQTFYINYANAKGKYGKSDYWDIFYKTPGAEALYTIKDKLWDEDTQQYVDRRDCVDIDMQVLTNPKILNKYEMFEGLITKMLDSTQESVSKDMIFKLIKENYTTNEQLLEAYWKTYVKIKGGDT